MKNASFVSVLFVVIFKVCTSNKGKKCYFALLKEVRQGRENSSDIDLFMCILWPSKIYSKLGLHKTPTTNYKAKIITPQQAPPK